MYLCRLMKRILRLEVVQYVESIQRGKTCCVHASWTSRCLLALRYLFLAFHQEVSPPLIGPESSIDKIEISASQVIISTLSPVVQIQTDVFALIRFHIF